MLLALVCALPALACEVPSGEDAVFASEAQPLATGFNTSDKRFTNPWGSPGTVNVCFIGVKGAAPDATLVAEASAAILNSWGATTGLAFSMRGACPASVPSTWISIFLDTAPGNGVAAMGGVGTRFGAAGRPAAEWTGIRTRIENRRDVQIYTGTRAGEYRLQVAHEVGHILGFHHEMERFRSQVGQRSQLRPRQQHRRLGHPKAPFGPGAIQPLEAAESPSTRPIAGERRRRGHDEQGQGGARAESYGVFVVQVRTAVKE